MYLVIKQENWSSGSKYYNISMNTKDYDLAVEYARCKQKEALEKEKDCDYAVVEFPELFAGVAEVAETRKDVN